MRRSVWNTFILTKSLSFTSWAPSYITHSVNRFQKLHLRMPYSNKIVLDISVLVSHRAADLGDRVRNKLFFTNFCVPVTLSSNPCLRAVTKKNVLEANDGVVRSIFLDWCETQVVIHNCAHCRLSLYQMIPTDRKFYLPMKSLKDSRGQSDPGLVRLKWIRKL